MSIEEFISKAYEPVNQDENFLKCWEVVRTVAASPNTTMFTVSDFEEFLLEEKAKDYQGDNIIGYANGTAGFTILAGILFTSFGGGMKSECHPDAMLSEIIRAKQAYRESQRVALH
jgi:hypothetical protein